MKHIKFLFLKNYFKKYGSKATELSIGASSESSKKEIKTAAEILKAIQDLDGRAVRNISAV